MLYYTILYYIIQNYTIIYCTKLHYTLLYYIMLYYSWGKKSCHACWKLMLESKIKQFYHPRSEHSLQSTHMINRGGFFWSLVAGFTFISRDYYFGTPSDECFCNVKKTFLTTIMYMATRDAFKVAKNPHITGLKRYVMNSSSRALLIFLFRFAKIALIREEIVVLLKKSADEKLLPKFI